jgi:two-component sensor histidine kinase
MSAFFGMLDHVPVGIAVCGCRMDVRFWNACIEDWTGIGRAEIQGLRLDSFFPRLASERYRSRLELLLEGGPPVIFSYQLNGCLFPHRTPGSFERVQHVTVTGFQDEGGERLLLVAVEDRTEVSKRIRAARAELAKRIQIESELRKSVEEKEYLMRELNHRVKNNLNMIVSLIGLQKLALGSGDLLPVLEDLESRVRSFASLHEALHKRDAGTTIAVDEYLRAVIGEIMASLKPTDSSLDLVTDFDPVELHYRDALYLGLIASETVTNSLKYGRKDSGGGTIRISLKKNGSACIMAVEDDGPGFPPDRAPGTEESLGLNLVRLFAEELGGEAAFSSGPGAKVSVYFNTGT